MSKERGKNESAPGHPTREGAEAPSEGGQGFASPPCFLHEFDPAWLGYMSRPELLDLLNTLLENERAAERRIEQIGAEGLDPAGRAALDGIAEDAARFRLLLCRHIERLGGTPSPNAGPLCDDIYAGVPAERADAVCNRQGWFVRRLRDALPAILDEPLRADLQEMLAAHERHGACRGTEP